MRINDFFLNKFYDIIDPAEKEKFDGWLVKIAEKIAEIAVESKNKDLINIIVNDKSFDINFFHYDDNSLRDMFRKNEDIEKVAYKVLDIMVKNNKDKNES